ncbi:hypothetical protein K1719_030341 [Acacia pycnantha]|nr:hypothetical protein K1719_030341 [Acacia pycnantha]
MADRVSRCFFFVFVLLFLVSLPIQISTDEAEGKEFVLTLDHTNFSDTVNKHNFIVVEFYAPWCGHCKKLALEYEKAASILSSHDPPVVLAKVDANEEKNRDLATQFDVKGFPTIKIMRNGGKDVGIFPKFSREEFKNFTALAEKLRADYDFAHTLDAKYLTHGESFVNEPIVRLFKHFDELFVEFQDFHVEALEKFVEETSIPIVTVFNNDPSNHPYVMKFFNSPNAKAMLFVNFTTEAADSLKSKYREAAEQYRQDGISFLVGDVEASQGAFQYFGLKEDQITRMVRFNHLRSLNLFLRQLHLILSILLLSPRIVGMLTCRVKAIDEEMGTGFWALVSTKVGTQRHTYNDKGVSLPSFYCERL